MKKKLGLFETGIIIAVAAVVVLAFSPVAIAHIERSRQDTRDEIASLLFEILNERLMELRASEGGLDEINRLFALEEERILKAHNFGLEEERDWHRRLYEYSFNVHEHREALFRTQIAGHIQAAFDAVHFHEVIDAYDALTENLLARALEIALTTTEILNEEALEEAAEAAARALEEAELRGTEPEEVEEPVLREHHLLPEEWRPYVYHVSRPRGGRRVPRRPNEEPDTTPGFIETLLNPYEADLTRLTDIDPNILNNAILLEFDIRTGEVLSLFYGDRLDLIFGFAYLGDNPLSVLGPRGESYREIAKSRSQGFAGLDFIN